MKDSINKLTERIHSITKEMVFKGLISKDQYDKQIEKAMEWDGVAIASMEAVLKKIHVEDPNG